MDVLPCMRQDRLASKALASAFFGKPSVADDFGDNLFSRADDTIFGAHPKSPSSRSYVLRAVTAGHFVLRTRHHVGGVGGQEDRGRRNVVRLQPADLERDGWRPIVPGLLRRGLLDLLPFLTP